MLEEVRLQQMCAHTRILRVFDSCDAGTKRYVALEFCPHGDLSDLIRDKSAVGFVLAEMVGYMVDLLSAVAHMHSCGIVHRDIKPANILVDADCQVRLCDLGLARSRIPLPLDDMDSYLNEQMAKFQSQSTTTKSGSHSSN